MDLLFYYNLIFFICSPLIKFAKLVKVIPLHLEMSPNERLELFGTKNENVPDYEIVHISHTIAFNDSKPHHVIKFNAFGEAINLNVQKKDSVFSVKTPVFIATGVLSNIIVYKRVRSQTLENSIKFFEDPSQMAKIGVRQEENGDMVFTINLKSQLTLLSIRQQLIEKYNKSITMNKKSIRASRSARTPYVSGYHIVLKNRPDEDESNGPKISFRRSSFGYYGPDTIYPRILVHVTYSTEEPLFISSEDSRLHDKLIYLVCFWNAVNEKFKDFEFPRINLRIASIIIANNKLAAPFLISSKRPGTDLVQGELALNHFMSMLNESTKFKYSWDIAVIQTDFELRLTGKGDEFVLHGMAHHRKLCNQNRNLKIRTSLILQDRFNFSGVIVAAHEIGHIFGASHDMLCKGSYIMHRRVMGNFGSNRDSWSDCSKSDILDNIRQNTAECWPTISNHNSSDTLPLILPGHLMNMTEQCKFRQFDRHCEEGNEVKSCRKLNCWNDSFLGIAVFDNCEDGGIPLDGTPCGKEMHCINQQCVSMKD